MATLQKLRAERRKYYQSLLALMKQLDGTQEAIQRHLRTCLGRKKGFIDVVDWQKDQANFATLTKHVNAFGTLLGKGFIA